MKLQKVNKLFRRAAVSIIRRRIAILAGFALIIALSIAGIKQISIKTSWDDYFVSDDPMVLKTDEFKSIFGNDYYVAVLVKNDSLFSKPTLELIRELSNELRDSLSYADKITSITDLEFASGTEDGMNIEQIVPEDIPSDKAALEEIRRKAHSKPYFSGRLVSRDDSMTWILLKLRPFPEPEEWKKVTDISPDMLTGKEAGRVIRKEKYSALHPAGTGMPFMSYEKMQFLESEMSRNFLFVFILSIITMIIVTRSLRGVVAPIITSVSGLIIGMGLAGAFGVYVDMTTMMISIIVSFACSIAYNIHLYNYFKTRYACTGLRIRSVVEAVSETGWSILLSALTTTAAMMTFLVMEIVPMKAVGIDTSLCLLSVVTTCLFISPVILSFGNDRPPLTERKTSLETRMGDIFERFGAWVIKRHAPIFSISLIVSAICGIGLIYIEPAFDVERTMGRKVPYVNEFLNISETELGSMYSYDLMITLPEVDDAKKPENLRKLDKIARRAESYEQTKRHSSILDIIKDMNYTLNNNDTAKYVIPESSDMVAQLLLLYENAGGTESEYWMDYDYRRLRLQIEIHDFNSLTAEKEMEDIQDYARRLYPEADISAVGNLPQFIVMQQYIERGQIWSMLISVLVIGMILVIIFGSWRVGLIGMIPNLAPAIIVGGLMGWLDYPLDMMTASLIPMVLGIAVDDTIHFINHAHLSYEQTGNYDKSIKKAFRTEGLAIVMSTFILSMTFLGFCISDCIQTSNWGRLAATGMISALLADLLLTPILFKYLKVFGKEKNK